MKVDVLSGGDIQVVAISGDFLAENAATVRRVCQDLVEEGQRYILIDFAEVDKIDGFSMASLVGMMARLRSRGGDLALVAVNPDLRKRLQKGYLDQVFPIYSTQAQATDRLTP